MGHSGCCSVLKWNSCVTIPLSVWEATKFSLSHTLQPLSLEVSIGCNCRVLPPTWFGCTSLQFTSPLQWSSLASSERWATSPQSWMRGRGRSSSGMTMQLRLFGPQQAAYTKAAFHIKKQLPLHWIESKTVYSAKCGRKQQRFSKVTCD